MSTRFRDAREALGRHERPLARPRLQHEAVLTRTSSRPVRPDEPKSWKGRSASRPPTRRSRPSSPRCASSTARPTRDGSCGVKANEPKTYGGNTPIVEAVGGRRGPARPRQPLPLPPQPGGAAGRARREPPFAAGDPGAPRQRRRRRDPDSSDDQATTPSGSSSSCSPRTPAVQRGRGRRSAEYPLVDGVEPRPGCRLDRDQGPRGQPRRPRADLQAAVQLLNETGTLATEADGRPPPPPLVAAVVVVAALLLPLAYLVVRVARRRAGARDPGRALDPRAPS